MIVGDETASEIQRARRRILSEPPAAERPKWESPAVGDVVQVADGRLYRHVTGVNSGSARPVTYRNQWGQLGSCTKARWVSWCAKAVREGGHYRRAGEAAR